jgi:Protein of unknown function (DUF2934)
MDLEKQSRIERRAYLFWEAEGQPHGRHEEHWRRAAKQIEAEETVHIAEKPNGQAPKLPRVEDGKNRRNSAASAPPRAGTVLVAKIARSGPSRRARGRSGPGSPDLIRTSFPDQPSPLLSL